MTKFAICLTLLSSFLASQSQAIPTIPQGETALQNGTYNNIPLSKHQWSLLKFGPGVGGDPLLAAAGPGVGGDPVLALAGPRRPGSDPMLAAAGPGVGGDPVIAMAGPGVGGDPS